MLIAITRAVSPSINHCELTHLGRTPINFETARRQHHQYETLLESLGVEVHSLSADPDLPDSAFVEDTAIVLDECAIITRPGAESRRPETAPIARALAPYRNLVHIQPPGIIDGGDVLRVDKRLYVGLSTRSNQSAIDQMQAALAPYGYAVKGIEIANCLHLKTAVTQVATNTLLINPAWVDKSHFPSMNFIEVDPAEPFAANTLLIGDTVVYQPAYPKTRQRLEEAGLRLALVDASELGKAEGALTCCSLVFTS